MSDMIQTAIRLPVSFVERVDALQPYVRKRFRSGGSTTRSDVLRKAIERGLDELELEDEVEKL